MSFSEQVARADMMTKEALKSDFAANIVDRVSGGEISAKDLDELPFGAIQLNRDGVILQFNNYESRLSGIAQNRAIGKHFFTDLAPCTNVKEFYGRFQQGVKNKQLHEKFRYHFAFRQNPRDVTVTLFYSEITESIWVFVRPA